MALNDNQRPTVLLVAPNAGGGGIAGWLRNIFTHGDLTNQYQFTLATQCPQAGQNWPIFAELGVDVVPCPRGLSSLRGFLNDLGAIIDRKGGFDILHTNMNRRDGAILWLGKRRGITVRVSHAHSGNRRGKHQHLLKIGDFASRLLRNHFATHVASVSKIAGEVHFGQTQDVIQLPIGISIGPSLNDGSNLRDELYKKFGIPLHGKIIGHVGRFFEQKNHDFLIDIFSEALKRMPALHLVLVGEGPLSEQIKEKTLRLGIADHVHFLGFRNDVWELLLHVIDLVCFPSLFEGLPLSLLEVQAAGVPCVASNVIAGETAVIKDNIKWIGLDQSASVWAEELLHLLDRHTGLTQEKCRRLMIESPYSAESAAKRLAEFYDDALRLIP